MTKISLSASVRRWRSASGEPMNLRHSVLSTPAKLLMFVVDVVAFGDHPVDVRLRACHAHLLVDPGAVAERLDAVDVGVVGRKGRLQQETRRLF